MLALFALAVQFAVAFGHIHLPASLTPSGPSAITASITLDGDAAGPVGKHHPASDVFCDICATLSLTANAQAASVPVLAVPSFVTLAQVVVPGDTAPSARRYVLAQSRAPPAV
jgi:hypothetical protein